MEIKLRSADVCDIPVLKNLWQICFGDRMRYIDVFFEKMFIAEDTIVAENLGKICGVVYVLKRTLCGKEIMYGYAIGVFPEYRGNGICEKMLQYVKEKAEKNGAVFCLHPANDKLSQFYKRIGLKEMYSLKEVDASNFSSENNYPLENITAEEMYSLRQSSFDMCVEWDIDAIRYILENGETVKKIALHQKTLYFVVSLRDDGLLVKETNASDEEIKEVSESIKRAYNAENITYLLSSKSTLQGKIKPMVLGFSEKNDDVYMNLFLD